MRKIDNISATSKTPNLLKSYCVATLLISPAALTAEPIVKVTNGSWDAAAGMFAYTEFELSGQPLAEGLGLNLDVLDPDQANKPDSFDYTAGIDSYEFSEEAMYSINYKSGLGPHLANGPVNTARANGANAMETLGKRVVGFAHNSGKDPSSIPQNFYPISFPLASAVPHFGQPVDVSVVATTPMNILTHKGEKKAINAILPAFIQDYKSLRWDMTKADMVFTPQAVGMEMLKDSLWAQDYMRFMHSTKEDAEIDNVPSSDYDKGADISIGQETTDGFNGQMLTEITWDKMTMLRDSFIYDGTSLGAKLDHSYDASKTPLWLPSSVDVTFSQKNGLNALGDLKVTDGSSTLRSTWMMLWPLAEFYGYSDHRTVNTNQRNGFLAVFDGDPFPVGAKENLSGDPLGTVVSDDPFSIAQLLLRMMTENLDEMFFDSNEGTFVDTWSAGKSGDTITALDAFYTVVTLQIYQRAVDALPVGYASASSGKPLGTAEGKDAIAKLTAQSDFILKNMVSTNGLIADSFTIGKGASGTYSVPTQFAAIRGFDAAFLATGDAKYKDAARKAYLAAEENFFDKDLGIYSNTPGKPAKLSPWEAGTVSGAIRVLMLDLVSRSGESDQRLSLGHLAQRYTAWYKTVGQGIQLSEWLNDTGEHITAKNYDGDVNQNGIKSPTYAGGAHGVAPVMAAEIIVQKGN